MSDLFKNHIVGYSTRWLICLQGMHELLIKELNHQIYEVSSQASNSLKRAGSARRGELSLKAMQEIGSTHVRPVASKYIYIVS